MSQIETYDIKPRKKKSSFFQAIANTESNKIKSALCKLGEELQNDDDALESLEKKSQSKPGSKKTKSKAPGEELKTIHASLFVPLVSASLLEKILHNCKSSNRLTVFS